MFAQSFKNSILAKMPYMQSCPICETDVIKYQEQEDEVYVECTKCGKYFIDVPLSVTFREFLKSDPDASAKVGHALRKMQRSNRIGRVYSSNVEKILKNPLPSPKEQVDLLLRCIAEESSGPGESVSLTPVTHGFKIGAKSERGFRLILKESAEMGLLNVAFQESHASLGNGNATLTVKGWERYDSLNRGISSYGKGFMAMKFGDRVLDDLVETVFKQAAKKAGFDLLRLDDYKRAGLIDDKLRVEIQSADFVVADLTHDNLGAYWEAGYAEGLGKPVIYTCEKGKFDSNKSHFDTNHHLTVLWEDNNREAAGEDLKATIRATLPSLAIQKD